MKYFSTFTVAGKAYRMELVPNEETFSLFKENADLSGIKIGNDCNMCRIWKIIDSSEDEALIIQFKGDYICNHYSAENLSVFVPARTYSGIMEAAVTFAIEKILKKLFD